MKKLLWVVIWVLLTLTLLAFFGFAWAPLFIRGYIEKNYTGVSVGDASIRWQYVVLKDVRVQRKGLNAVLPTVFVDWDKNAILYGGLIDLTLTPGQKDSGDRPRIKGFGLDVHVLKDGFQAHLSNATFDASQVVFTSGNVSNGTYEAQIENGHLSLQEKVLQAKHVIIPTTLPFDIPRVEAKQVVEAFDVRVEAKSRSATFRVKVGSAFQTKAESKAILADKFLKLELAQFEVNHPWVSPEPVTFKALEVVIPLAIINAAGEIHVKVGSAEITIDPTLLRLFGKGSCNDWAEAMPEPLPIALREARGHFSGDLSFELERDPAPQLRIRNTCKFECKADPIQDLRDGRIAYMAYDKNDKLFPRTVGPLEGDWTSIGNLPAHIPTAFVTLEDPGFNSHRGIIPQALENSLKDNLRIGRFFRGGSTISMQLSKNLWLRRHKTLGRKAQEVLLTIALESCLSKAEILELYLNVVEFGPNLYGIGPASKFYFGHPPERLEMDEAFYLASILPRPRKAIPPKQGGLERTRSLMRTLAGRGLINDALIPLEPNGDDSGWVTE